MERGRRTLILAGLVVLGAALANPVRTRLNAALTMYEVLTGAPRPFAGVVTPADLEVGGVPGRLYRSGDDPAVVLVPGATPVGLDDPRVARMAAALSRAGRTVFIPELTLFQQEFDHADLERIVSAVVALEESTGRPVTMVGFSYGGSFALVAAASPALEGRLAGVATLGAYFDLVGVVQAVTTGVSVVDGEEVPWPQRHPLAESVLIARTVMLLPVSDHEPVLAAVEGRGDRETLSPGAQALYDLLVNEDPDHVHELVSNLPPEVGFLVHDFSPSRVIESVGAPVLAMHSTDDALVPHAELARFGKAGIATISVDLFSHVDFDPTSLRAWREAVPDLMRVWKFTTWLLSPPPVPNG